jgi:predicted transcriptional regulator
MFERESDSVTFFGDNLVCRENNASFNHMKRHLFSLKFAAQNYPVSYPIPAKQA